MDDVLIMGDERWIKEAFLPKVEKAFRLGSTVAGRVHGGAFKILKRKHVVEAGYASVAVSRSETCLSDV